jgi:8-oxo-dGTP pyrophosphatase MutT (NUDIX family)
MEFVSTSQKSDERMSAVGWRVHDIVPGLRVRVTRDMPALPADLERDVSRLWDQAQASRGGRLFNGRVFSADHLTAGLIDGHWTEFRRVVARMSRPALAAVLPVRPLAAGGVVVGHDPDGGAFVVFGRRPADAVYQAGEWQLPPAGSIDPGAALADGDVDPLRQLHAELEEELGLPAEAVSDPRPLCLVEHPGSGVLDLGVLVRTGWDRAAIYAAHAAHGNGEYDPLELVALADLPDFLARHRGQVTRQALFFLDRAGLSPPAG